MKKIFAFLCLILVCTFALCACEGKSAYDIAVENGFVGTEEEWLESLKGEAGAKGEDAPSDEAENPQGLDFYPLPDGTYAVSAGKAIFLEEIVIPATYKGKKVSCVGAPQNADFSFITAFGGAYNLKKITLPDTITHIGTCAFMECKELTEINISSSIISIGDSAFEGCDKLLQKENGIHYVDKWAVGCDSGITAITLRSDTVGIAESAFDFQSMLVSIYIPASVQYIGKNAFYNSNAALTTVTVESANVAYYSNNNCLYDKATNEIIVEHGTQGGNALGGDSTGRY